jgi:hypothetical protein
VGNIDFGNNSVFSWYCVMLAVAGLVALAASFAPRLPVQPRILIAVVGIAALGYAYYLVYVFHGGTYVLNFYILALPLFLIGGVVRRSVMKRDVKLAPKRRAALEEEWDAERAWYAQREERAAQTQSTQPATEAAVEEIKSRD